MLLFWVAQNCGYYFGVEKIPLVFWGDWKLIYIIFIGLSKYWRKDKLQASHRNWRKKSYIIFGGLNINAVILLIEISGLIFG